MDLKEFIKDTLVSITEGIQEANDATKNKLKDYQASLSIFQVGKDQHESGKEGYIDFDIAVMASQNIEGKAGGKLGIQVASLGAETGRKTTDENVSRIKFQVKAAYTIK